MARHFTDPQLRDQYEGEQYRAELIDLLYEAATEIMNLDGPDNPVRRRLIAEAQKESSRASRTE